jgi:hypothetical protein
VRYEDIKGVGPQWLCPDCGKVLQRPPYLNHQTGFRFHSDHCRHPLLRVRVTLLEPHYDA